jgi:hypothetical protein
MAQMKKTAKPSTLQQIAKRFGITAREARDIATAVGTVVSTTAQLKPSAGGMGVTGASSRRQRQAAGDLGKQIKETVTAAKTGKSGTTALDSNVRVKNRNTGVVLAPGTKRK